MKTKSTGGTDKGETEKSEFISKQLMTTGKE
jgi:hypothetical protein